MNCPSRPDDIESHPDWNQNPQSLNADATTRADLNGIINRRAQRDHDVSINPDGTMNQTIITDINSIEPGELRKSSEAKFAEKVALRSERDSNGSSDSTSITWHQKTARTITSTLVKYAKFVGPGFLIAVAYIDPGNYATDVSAGASTRYAHLFIILMSNLFAIFLQSLCIKLGSVTGLDLAENCRKHLPKYLVWPLYILSEGAIIATDVAEVVGTAIALNLLLHIPLVAGCAISLSTLR